MSRTNPVYREKLAHYASRFEAFAAERSEDPAWLVDSRARAMDRFQELGFPSPRLEEWRYTNVAPIAALALELPQSGEFPSQAESAGIDVSDLQAERSLLWNARATSPLPTSTALSNAAALPNAAAAPSVSGISVESLAQLREEAPDRLKELMARSLDIKDRGFALLNTAFLDDGLAITVSRDTDCERPIYLLLAEHGSESSGNICHPRIVITALPGSRAVVVVDHVSVAQAGSSPALTNCVIEVAVGANASLHLVLLQRERNDCFHVSTMAARVERDGFLATHTLSLGGKLVRNELDVVLADEGAECNLRGLFLGSGTRLIDNHTSIDHAMPHGRSRQLYKGILADRSRGVFRGRVLVRPDAQKTDANQSNANLLLGRGAEIDTKPQLEIYADDVKCSHGSTIGRLDADALFYMRSRGIGEAEARALLIRAFASEIAEAIPDAELAAAVRGLVASALQDATLVTTEAPGAGP